VENLLGVFVWTALIVGSASILLLTIPDILVWCLSVKEHLTGTGPMRIEQRMEASSLTQEKATALSKEDGRG